MQAVNVRIRMMAFIKKRLSAEQRRALGGCEPQVAATNGMHCKVAPSAGAALLLSS
jgi:hypothetical protein